MPNVCVSIVEKLFYALFATTSNLFIILDSLLQLQFV